MKVSVPCPDPFSILTCHFAQSTPAVGPAPLCTNNGHSSPGDAGQPTSTWCPHAHNHSHSIPSDACLPLVQHLCVRAYGHMGSFNKKGEFPTVPHHLCSPTMAAASQAMLDGLPALAVQHPHVHQKGEMNVTTMTTQQQQQQQCNDNDDNDVMTQQQQQQQCDDNDMMATT